MSKPFTVKVKWTQRADLSGLPAAVPTVGTGSAGGAVKWSVRVLPVKR